MDIFADQLQDDFNDLGLGLQTSGKNKVKKMKNEREKIENLMKYQMKTCRHISKLLIGLQLQS